MQQYSSFTGDKITQPFLVPYDADSPFGLEIPHQCNRDFDDPQSQDLFNQYLRNYPNCANEGDYSWGGTTTEEGQHREESGRSLCYDTSSESQFQQMLLNEGTYSEESDPFHLSIQNPDHLTPSRVWQEGQS
ncbi:hypothetical protein FGO68_gene7550 [Halteria grandinella]|uniref:Uncharacterized protein n=1 Tax=Halteria grandinella TaxID=5974 RepID=A0A8J8T8I4_HALGN|nr:hypothetical protein FGO68_gene7550 [Halteria grandinella]